MLSYFEEGPLESNSYSGVSVGAIELCLVASCLSCGWYFDPVGAVGPVSVELVGKGGPLIVAEVSALFPAVDGGAERGAEECCQR